MAVVSTFFEGMNLNRKKLAEVCSDRAPAMLGSRFGFISLIKHKNSNVLGTHCFFYREALTSTTMPCSLCAFLKMKYKLDLPSEFNKP